MAFHPTPAHPSKAGKGPACSLGPEELDDRMNDWRSLRAEALISESVRDGVLHSVYTRREDVARRLRALIEAEGRCCPFLEFELHEQADVISVEVRGPEDAARPLVIARP